jgi:hypothetical protein
LNWQLSIKLTLTNKLLLQFRKEPCVLEYKFVYLIEDQLLHPSKVVHYTVSHPWQKQNFGGHPSSQPNPQQSAKAPKPSTTNTMPVIYSSPTTLSTQYHHISSNLPLTKGLNQGKTMTKNQRQIRKPKETRSEPPIFWYFLIYSLFSKFNSFSLILHG